MCVSHGLGGFCWGRDGYGGWHACEIKPGVGRMSGDAGVRGNILMTPDHIAVLVRCSG